MPEESKTPPPSKVYVLLDSNILQYLNTPAIATPLLEYLSELAKADYNLAISDFSIFELLSGIPKSKEKDLLSVLEVLPRFQVNTEVLLTAAQLATVYRIEKCEHQQINEGDKIIAATSILNGYPILTANSNDFPRPIFSELHKRLLYYKDKNKDRIIAIYLLNPDLEFAKFRYNQRP